MTPQTPTLPPAVAIIAGLIYILFIIGMITGVVVMIIAWWRGMKAHEKIAENLKVIAEKLQTK